MAFTRDMADWEKEQGKLASADGVPRFKVTDAGKHKEASELFKRLFPGI